MSEKNKDLVETSNETNIAMSAANAQAGDVRIRRLDAHNFVTERAVAYPDTKKEKDKPEVEHPMKGQLRWETVGHYGENLRMASLMALREGMFGDSMDALIESLKRSEANVIKSLAGLK